MLIRNLASFCVHVIIFADDKLRHGNNLVALFFQTGNHGIEGVGGVGGTVVAEDDGTVAQVLVLADCFDDGVAAVVFPVERVHVCYE